MGYCRDCQATWVSAKECHCPSCCTHFISPSAFDLHLLPVGCQKPEGETFQKPRTKPGTRFSGVQGPDLVPRVRKGYSGQVVWGYPGDEDGTV